MKETFTIEKRHHPVFGNYDVAVVGGKDFKIAGEGKVAAWGWNHELSPPTPVVIRMSHKEARSILLTDEEWDYSALPGEFAGSICY